MMLRHGNDTDRCVHLQCTCIIMNYIASPTVYKASAINKETILLLRGHQKRGAALIGGGALITANTVLISATFQTTP